MAINSRSTKKEIYVAFQQLASENKDLERKLSKAENLHTVALAEIAANDADLAELKFYKRKVKELTEQVNYNLEHMVEQSHKYSKLKRDATTALCATIVLIIAQGVFFTYFV